jgi:hypothetical protein
MVDLPGFKNLAGLGPGSYFEPNPKGLNLFSGLFSNEDGVFGENQCHS